MKLLHDSLALHITRKMAFVLYTLKAKCGDSAYRTIYEFAKSGVIIAMMKTVLEERDAWKKNTKRKET